MTEKMIEFINRGYDTKGVIIVDKFDEKVEEYLKYYETLQQSRNQRLVKDTYTGELFIVIEAFENWRTGRRTSHIILDSRISDKVIDIVVFPMLVGINRKVEIF